MSTNNGPQGPQQGQTPPWMQQPYYDQAPLWIQQHLAQNQPTQQGYPSQQQFYQQYPPPPMMPHAPQKWYRTNGGIIALLILFFPVGLYLMWQYARWPKNAKLIVTGILAFGMLIEIIASSTTPTQPTPQAIVPAQQPVAVATKAPLPTSTPIPHAIHYPPQTVADLHGLAAKGDASAIHEFHSESVGLTGVCPQPKRLVTVDPSITGQQLAEDLLAYFYAQQLDSPCGSVVFAYHNQEELNDPNTGGVYTAGRIIINVTDSSGQDNVDPNGTNLKHTLTLTIGGISDKEYTVTY